LLNLPPDRRGQIPADDERALAGFSSLLKETFASNLAAPAHVQTSSTQKAGPQMPASSVLDSNRESYWCAADEDAIPELILTFRKAVTFDVISLREYLPLGQRVEAFALDTWQNNRWRRFVAGTSIGNRRLVRCQPLTSQRVRLQILKSTLCPAISEFGLYRSPINTE
jgi:alpha-L-fucosidase